MSAVAVRVRRRRIRGGCCRAGLCGVDRLSGIEGSWPRDGMSSRLREYLAIIRTEMMRLGETYLGGALQVR